MDPFSRRVGGEAAGCPAMPNTGMHRSREVDDGAKVGYGGSDGRRQLRLLIGADRRRVRNGADGYARRRTAQRCPAPPSAAQDENAPPWEVNEGSTAGDGAEQEPTAGRGNAVNGEAASESFQRGGG